MKSFRLLIKLVFSFFKKSNNSDTLLFFFLWGTLGQFGPAGAAVWKQWEQTHMFNYVWLTANRTWELKSLHCNTHKHPTQALLILEDIQARPRCIYLCVSMWQLVRKQWENWQRENSHLASLSGRHQRFVIYFHWKNWLCFYAAVPAIKGKAASSNISLVTNMIRS